MFRTNQDVGLEVNNLSFVPRNSAKRNLRRVMGAEQSCCVVEEDESPDVILGLIQHENEMTGAMKS